MTIIGVLPPLYIRNTTVLKCSCADPCRLPALHLLALRREQVCKLDRGEAGRVAVAVFGLFLNQLRDQPGPAGLVARPETQAAVAVKELVEQEVIAPVR